MPKNAPVLTILRLDKWLWCVRFYKTRRLATEAVQSGKVKVNGGRAKPSKMIKVGDKLTIKKKPFSYEVTVVGLLKVRRPAAEACRLYEESEESVTRRNELTEQLKASTKGMPFTKGRPTKKDRRLIAKFKTTS